MTIPFLFCTLFLRIKYFQSRIDKRCPTSLSSVVYEGDSKTMIAYDNPDTVRREFYDAEAGRLLWSISATLLCDPVTRKELSKTNCIEVPVWMSYSIARSVRRCIEI